MQTNIADKFKQDPRVNAAEEILRRCVHCGFCLATCPTYNLLGDELDSPRGRIYLIKQVLEGEEPTTTTQQHLDRCLTCRNCETTCPSGVEYGHLVDAGRQIVEDTVGRTPKERFSRWLVRFVLPYPARIGPLVKLGQAFRFLLPGALKKNVPPVRKRGVMPTGKHARTVLLLEGCVQPTMAPSTNGATARVLDQLGISVVSSPGAGCCGAINFHLNDQSGAAEFMRRNIDAWWPAIEQGAEAIISTASGCGLMLEDYAHALAEDPDYKTKAARISELARDISEVIAAEDLDALALSGKDKPRVAYHPPCTLQHGQKLPGIAESILDRLGYTLCPVPDAHTCCGSAGTYSLFQKELSSQLKANKVAALQSGTPEVIATSNIGCQLHIQSAVNVPVRHWIELVDDTLALHQR